MLVKGFMKYKLR